MIHSYEELSPLSSPCSIAPTAALGTVACRFEVFYGAVELANGYYELTDAAEQQARFEADNASRKKHGKETMPVDHLLVAALAHGLPDCAGVALGVDRLMMILLDNAEHISDTLCFEWSRA
ncbi:MAG: amino acid--tRNA ligase-related protein [Pseudomonadota bacterium]